MNILSIQSWVSYGHVGNAAAIFPLQRMGHNVSAIHTVQFSNHTGYGAWRGQIFEPTSITEIVDGLGERDVLKNMDAVLSGYAGTAGTINAILDAVRRVRQHNPNALYCLDPVMGDVGRGVFVKPEIPTAMRQLALPHADIITPNHFELELLVGEKVETLEDVLRAVQKLRQQMRASGPRIVLVTSFMAEVVAVNQIETLCVCNEGAYIVATPKIEFEILPNGMGDVMAALFLGHYLKNKDVRRSLELAVSGLYSLLLKTKEICSRELCVVEAQAELVEPKKIFLAKSV